MGSPSTCDECGKKFKVFGIKRKCKHCKDVVCKACLAAHLELKHTHLNGPARMFRRRTSLEMFEATGNGELDEVHLLSPVDSPDLEIEYAGPDMLDDVDAGSDDDDDGDLYDDDADEDDELLMTSLSRQPTIEEEETQHKELRKIQEAVATWARKEKQAKQEMRCNKKDRYRYTMTPVSSEVCCYENYSIFAMVYAVMATVAVWMLFGLLLAAYMRVRGLLTDSSYVLRI